MAEKFKFRRSDKIGSAAAEDDTQFLQACFVDSGDVSELIDRKSSSQIIVGRTGSGKSALLWKINSTYPERTVSLNPNSLALTYVSNSDIVVYFSKLGINLDPFFKLLWRHILTVEVLNKYVHHHPGVKNEGLFDTILNRIKGRGSKRKREQETLDYLKKWGESFWLDTEYRVREITQKLEDGLNSSIGTSANIDFAAAGFSFEAFSKLSKEQKMDVISRAQKVVSETQIKDLGHVTDLLDQVLDDRQQVYYVLIDGLDENWVEDELRYRLIMALIVTIKDLNRVNNVKIIISMRRDLIDRVFRVCRPSGFQEEKYLDYYLALKWEKNTLIDILDRRVNHLIQDRYQKNKEITHRDVLPPRVNRIDITEYIFSRVSRPRDIIAFFNTCLEESVNASRITGQVVKQAEGEYSRGRLRALAEEWQSDYPNLIEFAGILKERTEKFRIGDIDENSISDFCLNLSVRPDRQSATQGEFNNAMRHVSNGEKTAREFRRELIRMFYVVGLVGLKLESFEAYSWVDKTGRSVSVAEINRDTGVEVSRIYHRALGIKTR